MSNKLHETNNAITNGNLVLEINSDADQIRDAILKWARGVDVKDVDVDDILYRMGDPIHSQLYLKRSS